jgi:hypothetical protein
MQNYKALHLEKKLLNSSELRLAEHPKDGPDLVPTTSSNSAAKINNFLSIQ